MEALFYLSQTFNRYWFRIDGPSVDFHTSPFTVHLLKLKPRLTQSGNRPDGPDPLSRVPLPSLALIYVQSRRTKLHLVISFPPIVSFLRSEQRSKKEEGEGEEEALWTHLGWGEAWVRLVIFGVPQLIRICAGCIQLSCLLLSLDLSLTAISPTITQLLWHMLVDLSISNKVFFFFFFAPHLSQQMQPNSETPKH